MLKVANTRYILLVQSLKFGAQNICLDTYMYTTFLFTQTVSVPCIIQGKLASVARDSIYLQLIRFVFS